MKPDRAPEIPWWAWLALDIAACLVVALALYLDKITGREALSAAFSISTCGFLAQIFSRKKPPGKGQGLAIPPSGVACLVLLLPIALAWHASLDRRA